MKERKSQKWLQLLKGDFLPDHNLLSTKEVKKKKKKEKKEPDQEAKFICKVCLVTQKNLGKVWLPS